MICIDECGPLSAKTYAGWEWKRSEGRATYEPDYGRRGALWVHGAFEPSTGEACIHLGAKRDSANHLCLLERVREQFPAPRYILIMDNLSIHHSKAVEEAVARYGDMQVLYLPKGACWLNLIEPWWKQLRSLGLQGKRFADLEALGCSLEAAVDYWNLHKYPYKWGEKKQKKIKGKISE